MKFERLGVFPYSHEEDTYCDKHYSDDVPEDVKKQRAEMIMELQSAISEEVNNKLIGKILKVLIDRKEEGFYIGRTEHDSPEVDTEVLIEDKGDKVLNVGEFYDVEITGGNEYDLYGKIK